MKRNVELVILSDVHLGTYGAQAKELVNYLQSIKPKTLVLNGDIIDIWQFRKRYFPKSHLQVIKKIISLAAKGTQVYYIIAKLGGWGYDFLIVLNSFINWCLLSLGRPKYSLSKKIKNSVKKAVSFVTDFEETAAELAIENKFEYVICGHIHQPQMRKVINATGSCLYLNSGDWIENLTALEYHDKTWSLMEYEKQNLPISQDDDSVNTEIDPVALLASIKIFN